MRKSKAKKTKTSLIYDLERLAKDRIEDIQAAADSLLVKARNNTNLDISVDMVTSNPNATMNLGSYCVMICGFDPFI